LLFNATTFSGYTATAAALSGGGGVQWSTYETSTPIQDVEVMRKNVIQTIFQKPNVMIVGHSVHSVLRIHPDLKEQVKYTAAHGVIPDAELARLFDVDKYLVGMSGYTADEEGTTATYSMLWGKFVLLAYVNPSPALFSPSLGYIISYKDRYAERYREDQEKSDKFVVYENVDEKIVSAQSGYLLSSVVA
jgi:hypothetical protein